MDAADTHEGETEDVTVEPAAERPPAATRLEDALGGELSRFLVTALASHTPPNGNAG